MEFLIPQEKAHLFKILRTNNLLQMPEDRRNLMHICGVENYCGSVQLDLPLDKFVISLYAKLSEVYINDKETNLPRLGLIVFLENLSYLEFSISEEDKNFLQHIISKYEQWQVDNPGRIPAIDPIIPQQLTRQEYRNRQALLDKVKKSWIKGVLEQSLLQNERLELGIEERFDVLHLNYETPDQPQQLLTPGTKVSKQFFDRLGRGRSLLILGEPGTGKTFTLLELAQDLIVRSEQDVNLPIPVVFNLSSWLEKQTIVNWLLKQLSDFYRVPKAIGKTLIQEQHLLLLLDGLDEVKSEQREACVQAINDFSQDYGNTDIVVASRIRDYKELSKKFPFQAAICIKKLTFEQVTNSLNKAGKNLDGVRLALQTDTVLQELAQTPLMLNLIVLVYQGVEELPRISSAEQCQHMWEKYIEKNFNLPRAKKYSKTQAIHWLTWLAKTMNNHSNTEFLIENIQPNWLPKPGIKRIYAVSYRLTLGLSLGTIAVNVTKEAFQIPIFGNGTVLILCLCLISSIFLRDNIELVEPSGWSWLEAKKQLKSALGATLFFGFILGLGNIEPLPLIISSAIIGMIILMIAGLSGHVITKTVLPNQGIWQTIKNSILFYLMGVLGMSIVLGINGGFSHELILPALVAGLTFGLPSGGNACIKYFILRCLLWCSGFIPWNYASFLDYATGLRFMHKVGGSYIFYHPLLQEHFTQQAKN